MSAKIIDALTVVAEITGANLTVPAIKGIAMELAQHPEHEVLKALAKCKRECKYRLTLADILERIDQSCGFIGSDEAWSLACQAMDESATVVMTQQIAEAWAVARDVLPDKVGARMAFREVYNRLVEQAKDSGQKPVWFASLGHDTQGREVALNQAVQLGRLSMNQVQQLLPAPEKVSPAVALLVNQMAERSKPEVAQAALLALKSKLKGAA
ncbi:hypothetical protein [uncultured Limnobacter sp.]|uniref:hypothetical protein n=1 Tax=uncultured Limnobacter sp. TaxID=199681 RepID=UPI0030F81FF6